MIELERGRIQELAEAEPGGDGIARHLVLVIEETRDIAGRSTERIISRTVDGLAVVDPKLDMAVGMDHSALDLDGLAAEL